MASSSTGRVPQGEVIMDFADGGSYIKHKLENEVMELERRRITRDEGAKASKALEALSVSPSKGANSNGPSLPQGISAGDVDLIVAETGCTKTEAEDALRQEKDVSKALVHLTAPSS